MIREHNSTCSIVTTDWDKIDGSKILKVMEDNKTMSAELEHLREEAHRELEHHHHHDHDDECCCGHDHEHEHHHHHDHDHDHDDECCCGHDHEHEHHHHHGHDHHDGCCCGHDHDHHHHHADEVFDEMACHTAVKYSKEQMAEILDSLDECGEVLRAKGIVETPDGSWIEFDYVPGEGEVRDGSAEATGTIIVIGTALKKDKLAELFNL